MPFSGLAKVTLAPAIRAPDGSATKPDSEAVDASDWAQSAGVIDRTRIEMIGVIRNVESRNVLKESLPNYCEPGKEARSNLGIRFFVIEAATHF